MCRLGAFFFLFKFLNYIIIIFFFFGGGGGVEILIFLGYENLWIFLGGHDKIGLVLGVS